MQEAYIYLRSPQFRTLIIIHQTQRFCRNMYYGVSERAVLYLIPRLRGSQNCSQLSNAVTFWQQANASLIYLGTSYIYTVLHRLR